MSLRKILRGLTPPALTEFYRRARGDFDSPWEGVYKHYRDVPASGVGYKNAAVVSAMLDHTRKIKEDLATGSGLVEVCGEDNLLFPLLGAAASTGQPLKILDFGGGLGEGYLCLKAAMAGPVEYHIVELERTCVDGRRLFEGAGDIFFHDTTPQGLEKVDIVHINSALQYIEDYRGLLKRLADYRPRYILLVRLSAGDFPTFATVQRNFKGMRIPHWFFNIKEITQILAAQGYRLVYKKPAARSYSQDSLPPEYRLSGGRMSNLLFSRASGQE